ncbi:hypothetical protein TNCT_53141 [Trichonephila clavata]|uniref:TIL domain-containing protein n=1 Tax=Trichonephila clavata TaxID=2740835 RepID=A0A8X6FXF7_TRICU|nr:hypothetical protein TNCT_53141 [Trichonephila clavata]
MKTFVIFCIISLTFCITLSTQCPKHQHMESCATDCPITCENKDNPPTFCAAVCFNGCVCDKGYIKKDDKRGPCVKPSECPN